MLCLKAPNCLAMQNEESSYKNLKSPSHLLFCKLPHKFI